MVAKAHDPEVAFIAGRRSSQSTASYLAVNPADGTATIDIVEAAPADVEDAVGAAQEAQRRWGAMRAADRGDLLLRWGQLIDAEADALALLDTIDMGKPLRDSRADVAAGTRGLRYWAGMTDKITGQQLPVTPGHLSYTSREPIGVCAVVLPWNGPSVQFLTRVAVALACGNAVVVKPSEWSPRSAGRLAELASEADLPPGLVNVLPGGGAVGAMLVAHDDVGAVSFTGSGPTGRAIGRAAAETFKRTTMELGGKSPNIVFADADLDATIPSCAWSVFYNAGQVCCAGTRLLVERQVVDQVADRLHSLTGRIRVGDPIDPGSHLGPLVCRPQYDRVRGYVERGAEAGATILVGGEPPADVHEGGFFVAPTIFVDVDPRMAIASEEIFGPVLTLLPFDEEDEAIALANSLEYGLSAAVWTSDVARMFRCIEALDAGVVTGNTPRHNDAALPYGGFKQSGLGGVYGDEGVIGHTRTKRVTIRYGGTPPGWPDV